MEDEPVAEHASPAEEDFEAVLAYLRELGATKEDIAEASAVFGIGGLALDLAVRPSGPTESLEEYAARKGVGVERVHRHWLALGFPNPAPFPFPVTADLATAIDVMMLLEDSIGGAATLDLARVVGSSAARLADALAETTRVGVELPQLASGTRYSLIVREYSEAARELLPTLLEAIAAVFRRHLVIVSYQRWSPDEANTAVTLVKTVGFVDLVGSTPTFREASPSRVAQLVREFERLAWDAVTTAGGRVVKLIGDEAMFVFDDPAVAARVALDLTATSPQPVRVGLDHGPVVALGGDYYGTTVNLAARLVAAAPPGKVAVSDAVGSAITDRARSPLGTPLRDFPDVDAYVLD